MAIKTAVYLGIFFASFILISAGITGFSIVSQSCCLGDACPQEQLCSLEDNTDNGMAATGLGIFLMMISLAGLQEHLFRKK